MCNCPWWDYRGDLVKSHINRSKTYEQNFSLKTKTFLVIETSTVNREKETVKPKPSSKISHWVVQVQKGGKIKITDNEETVRRKTSQVGKVTKAKRTRITKEKTLVVFKEEKRGRRRKDEEKKVTLGKVKARKGKTETVERVNKEKIIIGKEKERVGIIKQKTIKVTVVKKTKTRRKKENALITNPQKENGRGFQTQEIQPQRHLRKQNPC